jgi:hypothetical protein
MTLSHVQSVLSMDCAPVQKVRKLQEARAPM